MGRLRFRQSGKDMFALIELNENVPKIDATGEQTDRRHDDIVDQRIDNRAEGRPDYESNRQLNRVPLDREFFELFPNLAEPIHITMFTSFFGTTTTLRIVLSRTSS